jgi:hypothetical protein
MFSPAHSAAAPSPPVTSSASITPDVRPAPKTGVRRPKLAPLVIPPPSIRLQRAFPDPRAPTFLPLSPDQGCSSTRKRSTSSSSRSRQTEPESRRDEQLHKRVLFRDMTMPFEQQVEIEDELGMLDWAEMVKTSAERKAKSSDTASRPGKGTCACRTFSFQDAHTPQAFKGEPLKISHATLVARFEPLQQALCANLHKHSTEVDDEIHRHMNAILCVIARLKRSEPQSEHAWTKEDMQTGIHATLLITRLQRKVRPSLIPQPQQRPAWRS